MVGIRMPDHPVAQSILKEFGKPLAAPSANRFGRISPTSARHVDEEIGELIEHAARLFWRYFRRASRPHHR